MARRGSGGSYGQSETNPKYNDAVREITGRSPLRRNASSLRLASAADEGAGYAKYFNSLKPEEQEKHIKNLSPGDLRRLRTSIMFRNLSKNAKKRSTPPIGTPHSIRTHFLPYMRGDKDPETTSNQSRTVRVSSDKKLDLPFGTPRYIPPGSRLQLPNNRTKLSRQIAHAIEVGRRHRDPPPSNSFKAFSRQFKEAYYFVLEYLLSEGYADTYEDADGIFQVMSEEWFADILEI